MGAVALLYSGVHLGACTTVAIRHAVPVLPPSSVYYTTAHRLLCKRRRSARHWVQYPLYIAVPPASWPEPRAATSSFPAALSHYLAIDTAFLYMYSFLYYPYTPSSKSIWLSRGENITS